MTTAHRPTFDPARGKDAARGEAYHQRLLPAHKSLKYRQQAQISQAAQSKRELQNELLKKERQHFARKGGREIADEEEDDDAGGVGEKERLRLEGDAGGDEAATGSTGLKRKLDEDAAQSGLAAGGDGEVEEDYEAKKRRIAAEYADEDADDASSSSSDSDSEDDEEEDETAQLMAELAKIKAERAEAAAKAAAEQAKKDEEQREKDIALGNPLLNDRFKEGSGEYGVKRRWDDDVVFKNQARGTEERGKEKRFVNDLLRSDFHRRFMDKYVR